MVFAGTTSQGQNQANKPVVLIVDDEENILKALTRSLGRIDVDIVTATSAGFQELVTTDPASPERDNDRKRADP